MKNNLLAAFLLSLAPLSAAAQAVFPPAPPPEIRGAYVGATFGVSYNRTGCVGFLTGGGRSCDLRDPSFSGFAGYQLNRYFAGEVQYRDLGKVRSSGFGSTFTIHGATLDATAVARIEIYDRVFAYGRFGGYRAHLDGSAPGVPDHINHNFTYGLGVQWDLLSRWGARADWQRYRRVGHNQAFGESIYDVLSLGVVYRLR